MTAHGHALRFTGNNVPWLHIAASLALVLLWDVSGWDLPLMQMVGSPSGFPWRENYWLENVLHAGARNACIALYSGLWVVALAWPNGAHPLIGRRWQRSWWLLGVLVNLIVISGLKSVSGTSCPWDLQAFGGPAVYVSHWTFGVADGGGGRCFPGGHASSALAFLALAPVWLRAASPSHQRLGRWLFALALGFGLLFGLTQTLRGAHYPSHTLWTAWLCFTVSWLWFAIYQPANKWSGK
jgi:membrane-associated PAP2 superfamily phosphatase